MTSEAPRRSRPVLDDYPDQTDTAVLFKALGDRNRLTVVRELLAGDKHVYELNEVIGIEPNLLSHHLKVLRQSGIVQSVRDGKAVLYSLSPGVATRRRGQGGLDLGCCKIQFQD